MSDQIGNDELEALRTAVDDGGPRAAASVEPRNFRQPRRLSKARLAHLAQLVGSALPRACNDLAIPLRGYHKVTLASVSEVNVQQLFADFDAPFLVHTFECQGHTSWLVWENSAGVEAVESILAGPPPTLAEPELEGSEDEDAVAEPVHSTSPVERRLSRSERRVLEGLLERFVRPVAEALGLEIDSGRIAQEPEELTTLEDSGPDVDPRRLLIHFTFDGPGEPSEFRLYLPGVGEDDLAGALAARATTALPDHLESIAVHLSAYLGSVDVPLRELLELEVGDVIPLGVDVDSPLQLYAEDRACARARWGRWHGNLAVQIEELDAHPGDIDQPEDPS